MKQQCSWKFCDIFPFRASHHYIAHIFTIILAKLELEYKPFHTTDQGFLKVRDLG